MVPWFGFDYPLIEMLDIYLLLTNNNFKWNKNQVNKPFRDGATAGIECIVGSAIYLKSTGIFLNNNNNKKENEIQHFQSVMFWKYNLTIPILEYFYHLMLKQYDDFDQQM